MNLLYLLNIIRVLVTKLQNSQCSEAEQLRKSVKAAMVLLPLLGITNALVMFEAPVRSLEITVLKLEMAIQKVSKKINNNNYY